MCLGTSKIEGREVWGQMKTPKQWQRVQKVCAELLKTEGEDECTYVGNNPFGEVFLSNDHVWIATGQKS